ncbi:uncharacterized protein LOC114365611 [Ostrinia furnacalis]|uniref:uncharacterized protein LOC114365611 n=1 Tax=Ostrinia furnacalis TaxID=93504 RepID=UPI00103FF7CE|nr:uncharacterized protein LOC114365611 [Ostrinia furnacalis]
MGGKKRSRDEDYDVIKKKIRKLEKQLKRKSRHRRISSSSESSDEIPSSLHSDNGLEINCDETQVENDSQPECSAIIDECPELHEDILNILGPDTTTEKPFGDNLHKDVASRWQHILLNGLSKENRSDLLKTYLPPENCPNMRAPKLNLEIKAALTEINNKKDAYSQTKQNQLASCLSALGKALNLTLFKSKEDTTSQEIIKSLSDAGRLLCDYHFKESQSRRYAVINSLNKDTRDTIKNTKIDDFLFGSDLADHLKSSKAISKSGMELRPTTTDNRPKPKPGTSGQASAVRRGTLNARGAPQAPAAEPRANPVPQRRPAAPLRDRRNYSTRPTQRHRGRRT